MDSVAFASWIVGIRRLDASQRGRAFQELALAEANDLGASDDGATGAAHRLVSRKRCSQSHRKG